MSLDNPDFIEVLFHPRKASAYPPPEGAVDFSVPVADGVTISCRFFHHSLERPTLIFFHGNGEIIPDYDDVGPSYVREGLNFLIAEYRGYGQSTGTPLVSTFLDDSDAVFQFALNWLKEKGYTGAVFVMGRSLGSAAAIDVADRHGEAIAGLIIESGFARTLPLAKVLGLDLAAMGISEEETFDNGGKIARITTPTYILHGQYDQLIPIWQAEELHAQCGAKSKELQIVPRADHNSVMSVAGVMYFQEIRKFVEKTAGLALSWRERRRKFKDQQARAGGEKHDQ